MMKIDELLNHPESFKNRVGGEPKCAQRYVR